MKDIQIGEYTFRCENRVEEWRAETLFTKEEGTVQWLLAECKPGEVFYDIGANIGLYTVVAATHGATVYAFEPHVGNAQSLLQNIHLNECDQVRVITSALHWTSGYIPFHYASQKPGSSGSQLGHTQSETGQEFIPVATELKYAVTVDELLNRQVIQPATLVKLDVDGNELMILRGMVGLLTRQPPRSIQVEVHPVDRMAILDFMEDHGYTLSARHYTAIGKRHLADGVPPDEITHNAIFCSGYNVFHGHPYSL